MRLRNMSRISYRSPLEWNPENSTPVTDDTITQFALAGGIIEIRHKGNYLELSSRSHRGTTRLLVQPWVSNQLHISLEPESPRGE